MHIHRQLLAAYARDPWGGAYLFVREFFHFAPSLGAAQPQPPVQFGQGLELAALAGFDDQPCPELAIGQLHRVVAQHFSEYGRCHQPR